MNYQKIYEALVTIQELYSSIPDYNIATVKFHKKPEDTFIKLIV